MESHFKIAQMLFKRNKYQETSCWSIDIYEKHVYLERPETIAAWLTPHPSEPTGCKNGTKTWSVAVNEEINKIEEFVNAMVSKKTDVKTIKRELNTK